MKTTNCFSTTVPPTCNTSKHGDFCFVIVMGQILLFYQSGKFLMVMNLSLET